MTDNEKSRAAAFGQIRQFGDPVLKEESRPVEVDDELRKLVDRMIRIMHAADGVGLAAPQIGVLRKVIVFRLDKEEHVLVNPEITWRSEETITDAEGCLSLASLAVDVERAKQVRVEGEDLDGNHKIFELEGLKARILQHEIDHLEGLMIVNRTSREQRKDLMARLRKIKLPGED
ncbi:MAG: peptide deformylase [Thermoleophilia bacterium]